jgi:putative oxidoreductase
MFRNETFRTVWAPRLLSVIRILAALLFMEHGTSKYFGFPAPSPKDFQQFGLIGLAGAIEIIGSLLLLAGLWSRAAAFIMSGEMAVSYFMVRPSRGFFPIVNGGDTEILYCLVFFLLFLSGGGVWSLDHQRGRT